MQIADLIGTPYKNKGRDSSGYDCYGLVLEVFRRQGRIVPDIGYRKSNEAVFNHYYKNMVESQKVIERQGTPQAGDAIIFFDQKGRGVHVGVMLGREEFIHCDQFGVNVARLNKFYYQKWKVYRWL